MNKQEFESKIIDTLNPEVKRLIDAVNSLSKKNKELEERIRSMEQEARLKEYDEDESWKGKEVYEYSMSPDKTTINIKFGDPQYGYGGLIITSYGDCCSKSWFEHYPDKIEGNLVDIILSDVVNREENEDKYTVIKYYKMTIKTDEGDFDFEMRNSSNGYYGGNITIFAYGRR